MERALDPERLTSALGNASTLPSAAELGAILAQAEIGMFARQAVLDRNLLATAWYLHGIASADEAADLYPADRRRAAWQVSAHIFDIALEVGKPSPTERLQWCFAAQVGYVRGGQAPNAIAIHRRIEQFVGEPDISSVNVAALIVGCEFLRMDWARLRRLLSHVDGQLLERTPDRDLAQLSGTAYGPVAAVSSACRLLMRYLLAGNVEDIASADAQLRAAVEPGPAAETFVDARWLAAHLRTIGEQLPASSLWGVLPPDIPVGVRRAFTIGKPSVSMLWPPQLDAVAAIDGHSALDPSVRRIVLSVPTSSGKTLISQLFTLSHLTNGTGGVCFVVPTRSLAREVRRDLAKRLRLYRRSVVAEQSDWGAQVSDDDAAVEVMTPERLTHLIRTDVTGLLAKFGLFVFDEVHSAGEGDRGFTVESAVSLLHWLTTSTHHRLLLMSAALGNKGQVRSWVDPDNVGVSASSDWRGPRRLHAIFNTSIDWNQQPASVPVQSAQWPTRIQYDVSGRVRVRPTATGATFQLSFVQPLGTFDVRVDRNGVAETDTVTGRYRRHSTSTANYRMLGELIQSVAESGPVLVIRSTRRDTQHMAMILAESVPETPATFGLADLAASRLGQQHPLRQVLRHGVAYHHAGLPSDLLDLIEDGVRTGLIRYIVSTTSLTDGVNLPVRTVVIDDPVPSEWARPLSPAQVINAIGRAGRACVESEGWAILALAATPKPEDFARLAPDEEALEVRSRLADSEALDALAEFEALQRESVDTIFSVAGDRVSDFVSFVWLVMTATEELNSIASAVLLPDALASTLAWRQLNEEQQQRWRNLASAVAVAYEASDAGRRRRWGRVSTSVGSARTLDAIVDELVEAALASPEDLQDPWNCVSLLEELAVIDRLNALPEAGSVRGFKATRTGGARTAIAVDETELLRDWLRGVEINDLAERYLGAVPALDWRFEQLGDYLTGRFENMLSWLVSTIIDWTNQRLESGGRPDRQLCSDLGSYIRLGTADWLALSLMNEGIRSRVLANKIAALGREQGWYTTELAREGLRSLGPRGWHDSFAPTIGEVRELLEVARDGQNRLLDRVLDGESVPIPINVLQSPPEGLVTLQASDDAVLFGTLTLAAAGVTFAEVPSENQAELMSILELGVPHSLAVLPASTTETAQLLIALDYD